MADVITVGKAKRHYAAHTPLHGRSRQHKADLAAIEKASSPMLKADSLIIQRRDEQIDRKIEDMLIEHQGKRTRFKYNQEAVIGIEHLVNGPLDPNTQVPIWRDMLRRSKGTTLTKDEFYRGARAILCQTTAYDPETMGG